MPRLSIVIPCSQEAGHFEATLASVLQNRPDDCEVLVVQPRDYDDPYELRHEVQFVQASDDSSPLDLIHQGIRQATGEVVHLLSCDMEVLDGWSEPALCHFDDPTVGSVSPLVVVKGESNHVVSRGVQLGPAVQRVLVRSRATRHGQQSLLGPTLAAGFYRRQALLEMAPICEQLGNDLTDVDLGRAFRAAGYGCVHEADSVITTQLSATKSKLSRTAGRAAECLFWRHADSTDRIGVLLIHPLTWLTEAICNLHRPQLAMQLLGRAQGWLERASQQQHCRRWAAVRPERACQGVLPVERPSAKRDRQALKSRAAA